MTKDNDDNGSANLINRALYPNGGGPTTPSSSGGSGGFTRPMTAPTSMVPPSAGASGMMQAAASPGSIIQRSIQSALANRAGQRTGQTGTGLQSAAGAGLNTSAQRYPRLSMPTMTAGRQQAIDNRAVHQTPGQRRADPLNWQGIARDLGNAGDPRFRQHATGAPASSSANRLVRTQQSAARAEENRSNAQNQATRSTNAAKPKPKPKPRRNSGGGRGSNRAV